MSLNVFFHFFAISKQIVSGIATIRSDGTIGKQLRCSMTTFRSVQRMNKFLSLRIFLSPFLSVFRWNRFRKPVIDAQASAVNSRWVFSLFILMKFGKSQKILTSFKSKWLSEFTSTLISLWVKKLKSVSKLKRLNSEV